MRDGPPQSGWKPSSGLICHGRLGHPPVAGGPLQTPHKHKQGNDMTIPFPSFLKVGIITYMKVLANLKVFFCPPAIDGLVMFAEWTRERKTDQPCRNKFPVLPGGQNEDPETHEKNWSQWFHGHHPKKSMAMTWIRDSLSIFLCVYFILEALTNNFLLRKASRKKSDWDICNHSSAHWVFELRSLIKQGIPYAVKMFMRTWGKKQ